MEDKYKGVNPKIAKELAAYEFRYFRQDLPIPFCGLTIYPATVAEYERFIDAISCLTLDKNTTLDGLRMSNLDFLISKMTSDDKEENARWSYRLTSLAEICFHVKNGYKCPKCGKVYAFGDPEVAEIAERSEKRAKEFVSAHADSFDAGEEGLRALQEAAAPRCLADETVLSPTLTIKKDEKGKNVLVVDGHVIDSDDFNRLRQIILFQNLPDYRDESWIDPSLKADREKKLALEKQQNDVYASTEEKVVCLSISTSYRFEEIYAMSIRKFTMALSTVDEKINYQITKLAVMTGLVTLPKGKSLDHWIYHRNKDQFGDDYKSLDSAKGDASTAGGRD